MRDGNFALIYGSFLDDPETAGDIDLIYVGEERDAAVFASILQDEWNKPVDGRSFSPEDFRERLRKRDYFLRSLLSEDPRIVGDRERLASMRQNPSPVGVVSKRYNVEMADQSLRRALRQLEQHRPGHYERLARNDRPLLKAVSFLGYAFGYGEQARRIEEGKADATFTQLSQREPMATIIDVRERTKRRPLEDEVQQLFEMVAEDIPAARTGSS